MLQSDTPLVYDEDNQEAFVVSSSVPGTINTIRVRAIDVECVTCGTYVAECNPVAACSEKFSCAFCGSKDLKAAFIWCGSDKPADKESDMFPELEDL